MSACCPTPEPPCGKTAADACVVGTDDGSDPVRMLVQQGVLGHSRGSMGVWFKGSDLHVYVTGGYLAPIA